MVDFSGTAGAASGFDGELMPVGQLAWAIFNIRGDFATKSKSSAGHYLDVELIFEDGQPFARRKVWTKIGDPMDPSNSAAYKEMGAGQLGRILECGNNAGPHNVAGYSLPDIMHPDGYPTADYRVLNGKRVAVKIKVEKGTGGYADKNDVADFLSPNPQSDSNKAYQRLLAGVYNVATPSTAAPNTGFGGAAQAAPQPALPSFGRPAAVAPPAGGAPAAAPSPFGVTSTAAAQIAPGATAAASVVKSPSDAAAPATAAPAASSWLTQAQPQQR